MGVTKNGQEELGFATAPPLVQMQPYRPQNQHHPAGGSCEKRTRLTVPPHCRQVQNTVRHTPDTGSYSE